MTEPLSQAQRDAIGWKRRQGLADMANQFHYYRLTKDERILGGYDAVYRYGGPVRTDFDDDEQAFGMLSQHFFTTFPQLEGAWFTHRWAARSTPAAASPSSSTAHRGRAAYAVGYMLRASSRRASGRGVALDLLDGRARPRRRDCATSARSPFLPAGCCARA